MNTYYIIYGRHIMNIYITQLDHTIDQCIIQITKGRSGQKYIYMLIVFFYVFIENRSLILFFKYVLLCKILVFVILFIQIVQVCIFKICRCLFHQNIFLRVITPEYRQMFTLKSVCFVSFEGYSEKELLCNLYINTMSTGKSLSLLFSLLMVFTLISHFPTISGKIFICICLYFLKF